MDETFAGSRIIMIRKYRFISALVLLCCLCNLPLAGAGNTNLNQGEQVSSVVGGEDAAPNELSAVAALVPAGETQYENFFCSGILIDSEWVLTAAHCALKRVPHSIEVQLGNYHVEPGRGERLSVSEIFIHPDYISATVPDVALLHLATPSSHQPVPILTEEDAYLAEPGVIATASGWGSLEQNQSSYAVSLQKVELPIVSTAECGKLTGPYPGWITEYEVCAGFEDGLKDTSSGDSGGPLIVPDGESWRTAGLTSWGNGTYYGVYARVSSVADWIQDIMINNANNE